MFVRADLNVPLPGGRVGDDTRIRASLGTLRRLLAGGARVVLASHLGRPKGAAKPELSLRPVAERLAELLGRPVAFAPACIGPVAEAAVAKLRDGELLLLENLRFHPEEEKNDPAFARQLAALADIYVNDAFGTAHRAHASTAGIVPLLRARRGGRPAARRARAPARGARARAPARRASSAARRSPTSSPCSKRSPRTPTCSRSAAPWRTRSSRAQGQPTGDSLVEPDRVDDAKRVLAAARAAGRELLLPVDHVVAQKLEAGAPTRVVKEIPDGWRGVDIGPETAARYAAAATRARTIFWNGPMGVFEIDAFAKGTEAVANAVARIGRAFGRRRRRLARGGEQARARRAHRPSLDGRRRVARVRAGPRAARRRRPGAADETPIVAANWKMYKTVARGRGLRGGVPAAGEGGARRRDRARASVHRARAPSARRSPASHVALAAQNVNPEKQGAFTGEISPPMLVELGCRYGIVGHSERRALYGESDALVARKAAALLAHGIRPIVCVGETLEEREAGRTIAVVERPARGQPRERGAPSRPRRSSSPTSPCGRSARARPRRPELAQEVHALVRAQLAQALRRGGDACASSTGAR